MKIVDMPRFGVLRSALILGTIGLIGMGPFIDGQVDLHSWRLIPSVVSPTLMAIVLFVLPLDMTMARAFMSGESNEGRLRLRKIIRIEGLLFILLLLAWLPFFLKILRPVS